MFLRIFSGLAIVVFAGCGFQHKAPSPTEASITHLTLLLPGGSIRAAAEKSLVRLHQDHPEIEVTIITAPGKDYYVKGLAMMAAGAKLDLLWMGQGFGLFAFRDALLDLTPQIDRDPHFDLNALSPTVVNWYRLGGKLYGLPYGIDVQAMLYNQDLFEEAGLPDPKDNWTFDEYLATARRLTAWAQDHPGTMRFGAGVDVIRPFYFDLKLVGGSKGTFGFNNPAGHEWLQLNYDLLVKEKSFLRVGAEGTLNRLGEFLQQRIAMVEGFSWDVAELRKRADFRWKLAPMPLTRSGRRVAWGSSSGFSIAARTESPDAAWIALTYLVSAEFQREVITETIPALTSLQAEYVTANGGTSENLNVFLQMLPALEPTPRLAEILLVTAEWDYWMQLMLQGGQDPGDILNRAETNIHRILGIPRPPSPPES